MPNLTSAEWLSWPLPRDDQQIKDQTDSRDIFFARALGGATADLDIDFYRLTRPALVAEILGSTLYANDGSAYSADVVLQWTLHKRLQGLLAVTIISCGPNAQLPVRCSNPDCAEMVDLDIELRAFSDGSDIKSFKWSPMAGYHFLVDLPTGEDQLMWIESDFLRDKNMQKKIAATLVREVNGQTPPQGWEIADEWLAPLAQEFEQHDPLTALQLNTACPFCTTQINVDFDLEALLLQKLKKNKNQCLSKFIIWPAPITGPKKKSLKCRRGAVLII